MQVFVGTYNNVLNVNMWHSIENSSRSLHLESSISESYTHTHTHMVDIRNVSLFSVVIYKTLPTEMIRTDLDEK